MRANLRERLRVETSDVHRRLDDRLSAHVLSCAAGRAGFLGGMTAGYLAVLRFRYAPGSPAREIALRTVVSMGEQVPVARFSAPPIDEDAAAYVLTGAHLGMRVLARHWRGATDAPLPGMLDQPVLTAEWQALVARLGRTDGDTAAADRTVADAMRLFEAFHDAACWDGRDADRAA